MIAEQPVELTDDQVEQVSGGSAPDILIPIGGVDGESTDAKHKDWIEVTSLKKH